MCELLEYAPIAAAAFAIPQFLPQILKLRATRDTAGVSWSWATLTSVNNAAWIAYFAFSGYWTALVPSSSATVLAGTLATMLALRGQARARPAVLMRRCPPRIRLLTARPTSRRPRFTIERSSRCSERVPEGLDRFSGCLRVENEAGSIAPVLDFDAEFVHEISAIPKQVDDDSAGFTVSEMSSSAFHLRPLP